MKKLYALLVGIDHYPGRVPSLRGCNNDIESFRAFLESRGPSEGYELLGRSLVNEEATREAIIAGFREHLCQASTKDVVLFYYAGHGAQEKVPPELAHLEHDGKNETLVCYDSRVGDGWDLADKELCVLLKEVSDRSPHCLVILDCCHSGGGTRNLDVGQARNGPLDTRDRPIGSYLPEVLEQLMPEEFQRTQMGSGWGHLEQGRHVLLAACSSYQEAREVYRDGKVHGLLSSELLEILRSSRTSLTYRELYTRLTARLSAHSVSQTPQLEVVRPADRDALFLDGGLQEAPASFSVFFQDGVWVLDGGEVHGLQAPIGEQETVLCLLDEGTPLDAVDSAIDRVGLREVGATRSRLGQRANLDTSKTYRAIVESVPFPPCGISIRNCREEALKTLVSKSKELRVDENSPDWCVSESGGKIAVSPPNSERLMFPPLDAPLGDKAADLVSKLEHLGRWSSFLKRRNRGVNKLPGNVLQMEMYDSTGGRLDGTEIRLKYSLNEAGEYEEPSFRLRIVNRHTDCLWLSLFNLTELYKIVPVFEEGAIRLEPGAEHWEILCGSVPESLWREGKIEFRDWLKVIASTEKVDLTYLHQGALGAATRDVKRPRKKKVSSWLSSQLTFITVRPLEGAYLGEEGSATKLQGISLAGHPELRGIAKVVPLSEGSRSLHIHPIPSVLLDEEFTDTVLFGSTRNVEREGSVLELSELVGAETVTPEDPLELSLDIKLGEDESIVAFSHDGEFFLPLGVARDHGDGDVRLALRGLPVNTSSRSLSNSVKILFRKLASKAARVDYEYPMLSLVTFQGGVAHYCSDIEKVREQLRSARKILLYIHGIIGKTTTMVGSSLKARACGADVSLFEDYDAVLAFDYESLHTSIRDTAEDLRRRLEEVGFGAGREKTLHIVAHSMGGLVSRWFIEKLNGQEIVEKLVMLGTPNGGSPLSNLQDLAIKLLAMGLNLISIGGWPAKLLGGLLSVIESVDVSLDEMNPKSEFLKELNTNEVELKTDYFLIAGNTEIIPGELNERLKRLSDKLLRLGAKLPFGDVPNDVAVAVSSACAIGNRGPTVVVGCDHLTFFSSDVGLVELGKALGHAGVGAAPG